ncbi:hypothetical protein PENSPDRAFT_692095 [Peniophora sp. CONT]|nr:hypothetical protein PENSPDRAFT_692095 [Peniophora sp. CONT]
MSGPSTATTFPASPPAPTPEDDDYSSSASLSRRPRIGRGRQRALTLQTATSSGTRERGKSVGPGVPQLLDSANVPMPDRPPRSPLRTTSGSAFFERFTSSGGSAEKDSAHSSTTPLASVVGHQQQHQEEIEDPVERRRRKRGSSVPRDAYRLSYMSSASSPTEALFGMQTAANFASLREARQRLRESYITGTSSSLYPPSSSTDSPPSPRSIADSLSAQQLMQPVAVADSSEDFDPDSVDERLKLLLSNQYFLPPAHAKPALPSPSLSAQPAKPGLFAGIFRPRSKSKSSGSSPAAPGSPSEIMPLPALRTTGENASGPLPPRPWTAPSRGGTPPRSPLLARAPVNRVAVVKETLDDLNLAAQAAERDLHSSSGSPAPPPPDSAVIDPTDAVDLPPQPAAPSVFDLGLQASNLAGLGVDQSIGAAVLADRLVPPGTPGLWSMNPDEEAWRSALLSEAVSHSLNSTPAPSQGLRSRTTSSNIMSLNSTPAHDRRIVQPERLQDLAETGVPIPPPLRTRASAPDTRAHYIRGAPQTKGRKGTLVNVPLRADSPHMPHTPLAPPPKLKSAMRAPSPSPSTHSAQSTRSAYSVKSSRSTPAQMRRAASSPHMHEQYAYTGPPALTPPPLMPSPSAAHVPKHSLDSAHTKSSAASYPEPPMSPPAESAYGGLMSPTMSPTVGTFSHIPHPSSGTFEGGGDHESIAHSTSAYSQPSPTRSAFRDGRRSTSSLSHSSHTHSASSVSELRDEPTSMYPPPVPPLPSSRIRETPPPRVSSSLGAPTPLAPAPRGSSRKPAVKRLQTAPTPLMPTLSFGPSSPHPSISSSDPGHSQGGTPFVSALDLRGPSPHSPSRDLRIPSPARGRPTTSSSLPAPAPPRASISSLSSSASTSYLSSGSRSRSRHRRNPRTTGASAQLQVPGANIARALATGPAPGGDSLSFFDAVQSAAALGGYDVEAWDDDDDQPDDHVGRRSTTSASTSDYGSVRGWRTPDPHPPPSSYHSSPQSLRAYPPPSIQGGASLGGSFSASTDSLHSVVPSIPESHRTPVSNTPPRKGVGFGIKGGRGVGSSPVGSSSGVAGGLAAAIGPALPSAISSRASDDGRVSGESQARGGVARGAGATGGVGRTPSMLRLDGMLVRHMAAEREAISRIAASTRTRSRSRGRSVRSES